MAEPALSNPSGTDRQKVTLMRVIAALFLAAALLLLPTSPVRAADAPPESVFERVIRTNTLRCGWWNWPPLYTIADDGVTRGGIFFDLMQSFEQITGVKVEWTREIAYTDLVTDLQTNKVDAICAGVWTSALRGKFLLFSDPVFYIPINAYVRADDARFDHDPAAASQATVKAAVMDGEMSSEIQTTDFPGATPFSVPQTAGNNSILLMNVATRKADITFTDAVSANAFMLGNPGQLKLAGTSPLRTMANTIAVNGSEVRLKLFIDTALQQLQTSGVVERILRKYDPHYQGVLYRVSSAYTAP